jgi:hypothetical protein
MSSRERTRAQPHTPWRTVKGGFGWYGRDDRIERTARWNPEEWEPRAFARTRRHVAVRSSTAWRRMTRRSRVPAPAHVRDASAAAATRRLGGRWRWWIAGIALIAALALLPKESRSMSLMHLFSPVQGVVVRAGKPVESAKVTRRYLWHWKDKEGKDQVVTDRDGGFAFAEVTASSFLGGLLPHQPLIDQEIVISHDGTEYKAWVHAKGDYVLNSENEGRPLQMHCDLDAPEKVSVISAAKSKKFFGICELR